MALRHAHPLEVIDVLHPSGAVEQSVSVSLLRTPRLQLIRLVLPLGHRMPPHQVPGELTLHCLSGEVTIEAAHSDDRRLVAGQLVVLQGAHEHSLVAHAPSVVLLTLLHPETAAC